MGTIVVVGSSNTDMIVRVPHLPAPGETVLGGTFHRAAGGKGANQAVAAARAGGTVSFVGCLGEDGLGRDALQGLRDEGLDVGSVVRAPSEPSGVALIFVDDAGENCIAVAPGANAGLLPEHIQGVEGLLAAADVVVLQLEIPEQTVAAAARTASRHGARVILNPAPARPLPAALLADVSLITPTEAELGLRAGIDTHDDDGTDAAVSALFERGVRAVAVTRGARGAYVATPDQRVTVPGLPVEATDTTGAGDVFNGALAVALAEGRSLAEAARFGNVAAALSVTRLGAQPSIPYREEIDDLLDRTGAG